MSSDCIREKETRTGGRAATEGVIPGRYALSVGMPNSTPPEGWTWTPLSSIARLETGHTPSRKHPEYWGGEVPWIGIRDATGNHGTTICKTNQYTNALGIANSSARILPANTVCLSRTASVGFVVVMGVPMSTSQDFVNWVCGPAIDYRFLKYILLAEFDSLLRFASGTTHQTIYFPEAKAFHVCLPNIRLQNAIADILQTLDDRIAVLRETNTTLEAIAQALFKSWFVDFDPVRAKQEGREPEGMDAETAALFPDSFEGSELGLVPKGWHVGKVENLMELAYGKALKASDRASGQVPVYGSGGITGCHNEALVNGSSIVIGRKGTVGSLYWEDRPFFPIDTVFYVKAKVPLTYCFYQLKVLGLEGMNTDGAVPGLNRNNVYRLPVIVSGNPVIEAFDDQVALLRKRIFVNVTHAQALADLRDTLLPRLISGQLRLPDAETLIEEAAA